MNLQKPSCLKCAVFLTCRDPKKSAKHSCDRFKKSREAESILELGELQITPRGEDHQATRAEVAVTKHRAGEITELELQAEMAEYGGDGTGMRDLPNDFVWQAMKNAFDPETNMVRDLKVDDSALELAHNYFHFCSKIAGKSIKTPFARQLWIAFMLMGEYCPRCTPKFWTESIENIPVDADSKDIAKQVTLLRRGRCPTCKVTKSELVLSKEIFDFNQLVMIAGQRAGKSAFSSTISGYHTHLMLKAPRLSTICRGIQDFTPLTGTFVALTTGRAIKLLWNPFHTMVSNSEWFDEYFAMLDDHGRRYGKEFYKKRDLFIRFFHKNLDYYPMGPMKRTLRGDTRIIASTDELGWFPYKVNPLKEDDDGESVEGDGDDDEREMANGDEVHQSLDNSLSTIRTEVFHLYKSGINTIPTGLNVNISSPSSWNDKICRLYKESEDPETLSLGIHLPTWGINPLYTRDHPIIRSAYAKNPRRAERDFGANPPRLSENMFVKNVLQESFRGKQHHRIDYDEDDPGYTFGKVADLVTRSRWKPSAMGIDAGVNNNSFALAFGHRDDSTVEVMSAIELIPSKLKPVSFPRLYKNILLPLVKQCNILYVGADRWNSVQFLQQITEDTDGRTKHTQVTLNERDFINFQQLVNSGNLILPSLSWKFDTIEDVRNYRNELKGLPIEHLYLQYMTVQHKNGTVTKGDGYTDDLFRAVAVMCTMHFIPRIREYISRFAAQDREGMSNRSVVMVAGRSGGIYVPHRIAQVRPEADD